MSCYDKVGKKIPCPKATETSKQHQPLHEIQTTEKIGRILPTNIKNIFKETKRGSELTLEESIKRKQNL